MWHTGQKMGELRWREVRFQMHLHPSLFRDRKRPLENSDQEVRFFFGSNRRRIDEWQNDPGGADRACPMEHVMEHSHALRLFLLRTADEWKVHEPIATDRGRLKAILLFERVDLCPALDCSNGIHRGAVIVVNPFYVTD